MMSDDGVVLSDLAAVRVSRLVPQEYLLSYLAWLMATARCAADGVASPDAAAAVLADVQARMRRYAIGPELITRRQFNAFPDSDEELGQRGSPPKLPDGFEDLAERPSGPTLDERMRRFEAVALEVFETWYARKARAPDDLIHVSCSGYSSPSPAQRLLGKKGWYRTAVTHAYHMGCYGAFPAIRTAVGLLAPRAVGRNEPRQRVDIVHTEYLSAHVATLEDTPGDLIDMTLFGDGFIGYSLYPLDVYRSSQDRTPGFRVLACHEQLIPDSADEMTWQLGPHHFDMYLSKRVPLAIRDHVVDFTRRLCEAAGLGLDDEKGRMLFAIHPGGPKIVDHCREMLGIEQSQVAHARRVFRELGNMSSAAVPHVLLDMTRDPAVRPGTRVVALGFGPGLTASGTLLEKMDG